MIYKEHTRNQKRMFRIHKQEEKIQEQELIIASLQQRIDKALHRIQLIQMYGEVEIKDLTELAGILMGDKDVSSKNKN